MTIEEQLYERFQDFICKNDSPYFLYIHDAEGNFTYLSDNVTELLGFTSEEFQTSYITNLTANPINKDVIKYTHRALRGEEQAPYQVEVYNKDYIPHILYVCEKPVFNGNEVIAVEGVAKLLKANA